MNSPGLPRGPELLGQNIGTLIVRNGRENSTFNECHRGRDFRASLHDFDHASYSYGCRLLRLLLKPLPDSFRLFGPSAE